MGSFKRWQSAANDAENSNNNNYDMPFKYSNRDIAQDFGKCVNQLELIALYILEFLPLSVETQSLISPAHPTHTSTTF